MEGGTAVTYYEELGVPMTASTEEIREAYKHLARLLHPDRLQNPEQRKVAECQMRRLNAVYETLSHAGRRQAYDLTLQVGADSRAMEPLGAAARDWRWVVQKLKGPDGAWIGAGVIVAVLIAYAVVDSSWHAHPAPASVVPVQPNAIEKPHVNRNAERRKTEAWESQMAQLRRRLEEVTEQRDAAMHRTTVLEGKLREAGRKQDPVMAIPFPASRPPPVVVPYAEERTTKPSVESKPDSPGLPGTWYYARTRMAVASDLYPPEFIEAVVHEVDGVLVGRYRARYVVSDRAISPEVAFQFRSPPGGDFTRIPWTGTGGAKGEVKLRLLTANSLEVAWVAHDLGESLGLAHGTAVLIRAADRR